jgi:hypothetical protein
VDAANAEGLVTHQLEVDNHLRSTNISCNNAMVQASPIDESDVVAFAHNVSEAVHARFHRAMPQLGLPLVWGANWLVEILARNNSSQGGRSGRQRRSMMIPLIMSMLQPPMPPTPPAQLAVTHQSVTIINGAMAGAQGSQATDAELTWTPPLARIPHRIGRGTPGSRQEGPQAGDSRG